MNELAPLKIHQVRDVGMTTSASAEVLRTATPIATVDGVNYLEVRVVIAHDPATQGCGVYTAAEDWPNTPAARLFGRDQEIERLRSQVKDLNAQIRNNAKPPDASSVPPKQKQRAASQNNPVACPMPGCDEVRPNGQSLGRHCMRDHGQALAALRLRYATDTQLPAATQNSGAVSTTGETERAPSFNGQPM